MFNYFILVLAFLTLFLLSFLPGLIELLRAKDPGPVSINLDRDIDERYFSRAFKGYLANSLLKSKDDTDSAVSSSNLNMPGDEVKLSINRGPETVWVSSENLHLPSGTDYENSLAVKGDLTIDDNVNLNSEARVEKNCVIGKNCRLVSLSSQNINLGEDSLVSNWIDAEEVLEIKRGCRVKGRATAGRTIVIKGGCSLKTAAAPAIKVMYEHEEILPAEQEFAKLTEPKWSVEIDKLIMDYYSEAPIEDIGQQLERLLGVKIFYGAVLDRANQLELIDNALVMIKKEQKPDYLKTKAWLQSGSAIRIRGDLDVGDRLRLAADLIIEGDLRTGAGVIFEGAVHVKGRADIGSGNFFNKSIIAKKEIVLGENSFIRQGCDCQGSIYLKSGSKIGEHGYGGLSSHQNIYIEFGTLVQGKVFSANEIKIVNKI